MWLGLLGSIHKNNWMESLIFNIIYPSVPFRKRIEVIPTQPKKKTSPFYYKNSLLLSDSPCQSVDIHRYISISIYIHELLFLYLWISYTYQSSVQSQASTRQVSFIMTFKRFDMLTDMRYIINFMLLNLILQLSHLVKSWI